MNATPPPPHPAAEHNPLAGGQAVRLPGSSRDAALHDQLYRYAEDLQMMMDRQATLEERCDNLREICDRLNESRAMLDDLIRSSRDIHIVTDRQGIILQANPAAEAIAGASQLAGSNLQDWIVPEYIANYQALRTHCVDRVRAGEEWELRLRTVTPSRNMLIVRASIVPVQRHGTPENLHWTMRDETQLRETEFETQISSMVFRNAVEAVMITDASGEILAVNPAFTQITGYTADEVLGRNPRFLKSGLQDENFYQNLWQALKEKGSWQGEIHNRKKSGDIYPEWLTINAARDINGHILSYIAVFSDLSQLLLAERRLAHLAHYDSLTDLPNRLLFSDRLTQTLVQSRRNGQHFAVIYIDLDHFKEINDTLGHESGDQVLQIATRRMSGVLREVDTLARLGGDEFVVLAPGLAGEESIGVVCSKIIDAMASPVKIGNHSLHVGASLGCAEYPLHTEDESAILRLADAAMYRAKGAGGNRYCIHGAATPLAPDLADVQTRPAGQE